MRRGQPMALVWLLVSLAGVLTGGCGPTLYTAETLSAERTLAQARTENARFYAPYEYYAARAYLAKASEEARTGAYEDALRFARRAERLGERAIEVSRREKGAP